MGEKCVLLLVGLGVCGVVNVIIWRFWGFIRAHSRVYIMCVSFTSNSCELQIIFPCA